MPLSSLLAKEFTQLKADKRSLFMLFFIPLILIIIFGLATGGGPGAFFNVHVISCDQIDDPNFILNNETYEMSFMGAVNGSSSFGMKYNNTCNSSTQFESLFAASNAALRRGDIDAIIVLPANFSECISSKINVTIQSYIDGTDKTALTAFKLAMEEPLSLFRIENSLVEDMVILMPAQEYSVPSWLKLMLNYAIPLLIPIIVLGTTMNLSALSIVSEAPLPRLFMTPTGRREILTAKLVTYSTVMILQSIEIFVGVVLFGLYCAGSLFDFFLSLVLVGFVGVCMGLFISAIASTEQTANQIYIMLFIMITMFSGAFIPAEQLPAFMQPLISVFPLSHATPLIEGIMFRGLPFNLLDGGYLLLLSGIFVVLAYIAFKLKNPEV